MAAGRDAVGRPADPSVRGAPRFREREREREREWLLQNVAVPSALPRQTRRPQPGAHGSKAGHVNDVSGLPPPPPPAKALAEAPVALDPDRAALAERVARARARRHGRRR